MDKRDKKKKSVKDKTFASGKNYIGIEKLGKGTYGSVYKAENKDTKETFAIKIIKLDVDSEGIPSTALREIAILKKMNHPNVLGIKNLALADKKIELCLEYCPMDLRKYIDNYEGDKIYNLATIKTIMYQVLKGCDYLHSKKILHRDLKPQNILINDKTLTTRIADFGLSRVYSIPIRPYTREVLTLWYRAPELMLGAVYYSIGLDMWSLGCIFGELLFKKPFITGDSEIDQLYKIFKILGRPNDKSLPGYKHYQHYNPEFPQFVEIGLEKYITERFKVKVDPVAYDLLEKMLKMDPCKRISCKDALNHVI